MSEKNISKHLANIEHQFSTNSPVLQQATKVFHELDQIEFELGLLDNDETTARKSSWWPIVSFIGSSASAKTNFLNQILSSAGQTVNIYATGHKFTVLQHTPQSTLATLPGTALDVDHRLPFYQISQKIEQLSTGEGAKINAYLELKTLNSARLKNRLFIDTPDFNGGIANPVQALLMQHVIELSDLVIIFTSVFESEPAALEPLIENIKAHQDSNKFVYIIDHSSISVTPDRAHTSISSWQRRLADLGLNTGQFLVLSNAESPAQNQALSELDQRLANIDNDRSYRILHCLEQGIRDVYDVIMPEVESSITRWKERCNFSILIIIGFLITLMLFAEISMGVVDLLLHPIIGSLTLVLLITVLTPLHLLMSKAHAKSFMRELDQRQKELHLTENLAGLFEKSLTFWRMLLPINQPVGSDKKYRAQLRKLHERTKDLVQKLNDNFSVDPRYESEQRSFNQDLE